MDKPLIGRLNSMVKFSLTHGWHFSVYDLLTPLIYARECQELDRLISPFSIVHLLLRSLYDGNVSVAITRIVLKKYFQKFVVNFSVYPLKHNTIHVFENDIALH